MRAARLIYAARNRCFFPIFSEYDVRSQRDEQTRTPRTRQIIPITCIERGSDIPSLVPNSFTFFVVLGDVCRERELSAQQKKVCGTTRRGRRWIAQSTESSLHRCQPHQVVFHEARKGSRRMGRVCVGTKDARGEQERGWARRPREKGARECLLTGTSSPPRGRSGFNLPVP